MTSRRTLPCKNVASTALLCRYWYCVPRFLSPIPSPISVPDLSPDFGSLAGSPFEFVFRIRFVYHNHNGRFRRRGHRYNMAVQRNSLTRLGNRRLWLVLAIVGGSAVAAVYLIYFAMRGPASDGPNPMVTVEDDSQFWLQQRRPGKPWTERPYPRDQAIALLRAISMAKRWKPDRFCDPWSRLLLQRTIAMCRTGLVQKCRK